MKFLQDQCERTDGVKDHLINRQDGCTNLVGVHVKHINGKIICCEIKRLKDLLKREILVISMNDDFLCFHEHARLIHTGNRLTSGDFLSLDLMNRKRCFWFMLAEW